MLSDLKTAHLLRASPRVQFYAQCIGAMVSIFLSVGVYILFSTAYPCINTILTPLELSTCPYPAPNVGAWRAISIAVSNPGTTLPIPPSSGYFSIGIGVFAFVLTFVKYRFLPSRYHSFVPSMNAVGIAMILNTAAYPLAMAAGSTAAYVWMKRSPQGFQVYCYAIAAGLIAGEGLGGIVGAILQIAKVSGNYYGTTIGCPGMIYCG